MKYIAIAAVIIGLAGWYLPTFDGVGAISFPTSIDSLTNPSATDSTATVSHSGQHSDANDALEALEAKVGVDGSAVTTSHDYKLSGVTGSDLACSLTGTETLTNKTLTTPLFTDFSATTSNLFGTTTINGELDITGSTTIDVGSDDFTLNLGSDATADMYYRNASGIFTALAFGTAGQFLTASSTGIPDWVTSDPSAPTVTTSDVATTSLTVDGTQLSIITYRGRNSGDCTAGCVFDLVLDENGSITLDTVTVNTENTTDFDVFTLQHADTLSATTSALLEVTGAQSLDNWIVQVF